MGLEWPRLRAQYAHVVTQALDRRVNQEDLATLAGVAQSQISRAKNEKDRNQGPRLMTFIKIVEATGTSLTEFFAGLEGPRPTTGMTMAAPDPSALAAANSAAARDRAIAKAARNFLRVTQAPRTPRKPR